MTGKDIYDLAIELLGYKNADGSDNADCEDYLNRSVGLINILLAETLWLDRLLRQDKSASPVYISSVGDTVRCNGRLARGVLPFGLAAMLAMEEDIQLYDRLHKRYTDEINRTKEEVAGIRHDICDCYPYHG
ncbi:MAG: hypothetical protein E7597_01435 [Ruminococcaceae bacterium]|nr:hypothetical protein [Oscillospiraceae bacterium]